MACEEPVVALAPGLLAAAVRRTRTLSVNNSALAGSLRLRPSAQDSYLVDPASSHMLVSKIKPCMSKYKQLYSETANGSLNQL